MYKLYLKIALRYLVKNKLYAGINILGMAIGIASFILIMLYVNFEKSYDTFEGSDRVQRVYMDALEGTNFVPSDAETANLIGPTLKAEFPEVLEQVRLYNLEKATFKIGDKVIEATKGYLADESYFELFNYPLLEGNRASALKAPRSIVMTASFAEKIVGKGPAMGKSLEVFYNGEGITVTITGIVQDIPQNTHLKTNFLISMATYANWFASEEQVALNWSHCNYYTYVKLDQGVDDQLLKQKIIGIDFEDDLEERYNIEPITSIHLQSDKPFEPEANGSASRVKFLTAIAFIILILSWLNYINLSTTKSLERAKEVGIRKVAGAQRLQLIFQSLSESLILNVIALVFAAGISAVMLSVFNDFTGNSLSFNTKTLLQLIPVLVLLVLGILLAGLYPALLLSSYAPAKALKGKIRASASGLNVRKGLLVTQFIATIVLLIGTIVVSKQINELQNQPIGANLEQTVAFNGEFLSQASDSLIRSKYRILEGELKNLPTVKQAVRAQTYPGEGYENLSTMVGLTYPNGKDDSSTNFYFYASQPGYFDLLQIPFLAGEDFVKNAAGESDEIIINEAFMKVIEFDNPADVVGKSVEFFGQSWVIKGVVKNYNHFGLKSEVFPTMIIHRNTSANLLVKFNQEVASFQRFSSAIAQVKDQWQNVFPASTFNYTFVDQKFQAQYMDEKTFGTSFSIFTLLAVFIACLGLFGLTAYTSIQRKKEIGIRKVNGATISEILKLLNKDFLLWIGIAFVIAIPIAWFAMNNWLEGFSYKTTLSWWIFALAGIVVLVVALLTVSYHSFRAALHNPIDALRDE